MPKTTSGRIVTSKSPKDILNTAELVYKKHIADGTTSELKNLVDYDWDKIGPTITTASNYNKAAEDYKGKMEEQYRLRDALLKPIDEITKASSKYLKGKYAKNPKKLADWGYQIDDTPKAKKAPKKGA